MGMTLAPATHTPPLALPMGMAPLGMAPMGMAPTGMAPMGMAPTGMVPGAPVYQPAAATVAIVGDEVKVDVWSEYIDDDTGDKYYHNPAKPEKTTWEKPEGFDTKANAGDPARPTKPKERQPKYT